MTMLKLIQSARNLFKTLASLLAILFVAILANSLVAAEPFERFMTQLKNEKLFDLAVVYLDYCNQHNLLPANVKDDLELQKLDILQQELSIITAAQKRDERIEMLQKGYESFLSKNSNHARRGEARVRLADLYIQQGYQSKQAIEKTADANEQKALADKSRTAFLKAEKLFIEGVEELTEPLKKALGAKLDPSDTDAVARREAMQGDYRKSQIMIGLARKLVAETYDESAPEFKTWMTKAEDQFNDVGSKASRSTEPGTYFLSVLYRGQTQAALKKFDVATDSLLRVADQSEGGIFRTLRVQATIALIQMLASKDVGKYEAAIQRGDSLIQTQTPNEKNLAEWQDLTLALLQAKSTFADNLASNPQSENQAKILRRDLKTELQKLARTQGSVGDKARQMLSAYGVDVAAPEDTKIPKVRTFAEAYQAANERIDRVNQDKLTIEILQNQMKSSPDKSAELNDQLNTIKASGNNANLQAIELLKKSFDLFNLGKDSREDLATARFRLSYLYYSIDDFYSAAAVADLTARTNPGTESGLTSAQIAIYAYQKIIENIGETADANAKPIAALEEFAGYMLRIWPDAEPSQAAAMTLLRFALNDKRWDDAEKVLKYLTNSPEKATQIQRDLGFVLYIQFIQAVAAAKEKGLPTDADEITQLRGRAEKLLVEGTKNLKPAEVDVRAVEASSALASIYLRSERAAAAMELIYRNDTGPMAILENGKLEVPPRVQMEALRLALQSEVNQATTAGGTLDSKKIQELVSKMQAVAAADVEDKSLLTNALIVLANDLRNQLSEVKQPAERQKLGGSIRILLSQLIDVSQDAATLDWASRTLGDLSTATSSDASVGKLSLELATASTNGFEKLVELGKQQPEALQNINRKLEDVNYLLAKSYNSTGMFEKAAALYLDILNSNNMNLLAQVEAAKNYQDWSQNTDSEKLKNAMFGAEPITGGKNVVWGWGKLSQLTASREDLSAYFFNARFQLASCRAALAKIETDASLRTKYYEQALGDIRSTFINYPELSGPDLYAKFDELTRTIQSGLQKDPIGLATFKS